MSDDVYKDEMTMARERREHDQRAEEFRRGIAKQYGEAVARACENPEYSEALAGEATLAAERLTRIEVLERALRDATEKRERLRVGVRTLYFDLLTIIAEDGAPVNHPMRAVAERLAAVIDVTAPEIT